MLTLLELKEELGDDAIDTKMVTPHKTILRESGALVLAEIMIDDDTLLEVFDNGFVLYETDLHYTVFPFRDALKDYCYESVASDSRSGSQIPLTLFYDMPWVFRVLMEAEDRVVHNMYTSPAIENSASLEHVMDYLVKIRDVSHDKLDIILRKELTEILRQSEQSLTDYQRYLIKSVFSDERSIRELTEEQKKSRQAIEDVISRGLINMRKVFKDMGYEIESSLLKYK